MIKCNKKELNIVFMIQRVCAISQTNGKTKLSRMNYTLHTNNALILNSADIFAMCF